MIVTADQYPYIASSTSLSATVVPSRYRDGTNADYRKRFDDSEKGPQIRKAIEADVKGREKAIVIASFSGNRKWQGKSLGEIAESEKKSATDIAIEIEKAGGASVVNFGMSEEDVRIYMKQPWVATASRRQRPHPRRHGSASAELWHVPAQGRPILDRRRRAPTRTGDPLGERFAGRHHRLQGSRLPEAGPVRRCCRVRPEGFPRYGDIRQAAPVRGSV